jgi:hypothetical protein
MPWPADQVRTVRPAFELRITASTERTSGVMTQQFPVTCGEDRVVPRTGYLLREEAGGVVVPVTEVAAGPMTEDEAAGIARYGDLASYAATICKLAAR